MSKLLANIKIDIPIFRFHTHWIQSIENLVCYFLTRPTLAISGSNSRGSNSLKILFIIIYFPKYWCVNQNYSSAPVGQCLGPVFGTGLLLVNIA